MDCCGHLQSFTICYRPFLNIVVKQRRQGGVFFFRRHADTVESSWRLSPQHGCRYVRSSDVEPAPQASRTMRNRPQRLCLNGPILDGCRAEVSAAQITKRQLLHVWPDLQQPTVLCSQCCVDMPDKE